MQSFESHVNPFTAIGDKCVYWDAHCRDSGVILLASGGAGMELLQIWGHWVKGRS